MLVSVSDDGEGVPTELVEQVFEPFIRGKAAGTVGGSGVGLALCMRIVRSLGGSLWYDGSSGGAPVQRPPARNALMNTVLVVEDEADLLLTFRIVLETAGYRVVGAATGEEALAVVDDVAPDVIVLDLILPGIDGWSVLDALRASEATATVPVIIASANVTPDQEQRAAASGCSALFTKPFGAEEFRRTVQRLVGADGSDGSDGAPPVRA